VNGHPEALLAQAWPVGHSASVAQTMVARVIVQRPGKPGHRPLQVSKWPLARWLPSLRAAMMPGAQLAHCCSSVSMNVDAHCRWHPRPRVVA